MADLIVQMFRWYRQCTALFMLGLIGYLSYDFYKITLIEDFDYSYFLKGIDLVPIVPIAAALIGINVLVMFIFSPRGSTLWVTIFSLLWNGSLWFQTEFLPKLNESSVMTGFNNLLKHSLFFSGIWIVVCFILEWKSRYRMGWEFY